jgi:hypothetical protein
MKKFFVVMALAASSMLVASCTQQESPAPTVTITEQAPTQPPSIDDEEVYSESRYLSFVRENGGMYALVASDSDLLSIGENICDGLLGGLSRDQIIDIVARALVSNGMDNQDGAVFGATLIVGAERYLCSTYA